MGIRSLKQNLGDSKIERNLVPENVKKGVGIGGVVGSLMGNYYDFDKINNFNMIDETQNYITMTRTMFENGDVIRASASGTSPYATTISKLNSLGSLLEYLSTITPSVATTVRRYIVDMDSEGVILSFDNNGKTDIEKFTYNGTLLYRESFPLNGYANVVQGFHYETKTLIMIDPSTKQLRFYNNAGAILYSTNVAPNNANIFVEFNCTPLGKNTYILSAYERIGIVKYRGSWDFHVLASANDATALLKVITNSFLETFVARGVV
ncbi:hypothetical protein ACFSO7_20650 [Bacillus sp. CGMCC 1.16607]|uniref:hypothetical protein n=1 Tax=Bacillus sp. CGMCC 1.16607 TaxID=3351842 RepID=UPI003629CCCC